MDSAALAPLLDLANHHANSTFQDVRDICDKVLKYGFNSVFINPCYVSLIRQSYGPKIKIGTVISFPLGQDNLDIKFAAAKRALSEGADELDISLNIGQLKLDLSESPDKLPSSRSLYEMKSLVDITKNFGQEKIIKFIIESSYLTPDEIIKASQAVLTSGADFVKSDSGMGPRGATVENIKIIKQAVGNQIKIKAAGGIETYDQAVALISAGADRLGTSHAVEIVTQAKSSSQSPSASE